MNYGNVFDFELIITFGRELKIYNLNEYFFIIILKWYYEKMRSLEFNFITLIIMNIFEEERLKRRIHDYIFIFFKGKI